MLAPKKTDINLVGLQANNRSFTVKELFAIDIYGILFLTIAAAVFFLILNQNVPTDIQLHSEILGKYLAQQSFPNPPLYYLSIYLLNLLFANNFIYAAIVTLSLASYLKFNLVKRYLAADIVFSHFYMPGLLAFTLMFVSAVFVYYFDGDILYLGKFTSAIWHNSTTIFVFPFCIWLYIESLQYLKLPETNRLFKLAGISFLILLAKPSFLFAFIPVFPLMCLYRFGWKNRWFRYAGLLSATIFALLILQKFMLYQNNPLDKLVYNGELSKVVLAPFQVWLSWAQNPLLNLASSFLFLFAFLILKFSVLKRDIEVIYSLSLLIFSLSIFFILAESGPRLRHGNFFWQVPISMLIVNMVLLKKVVSPYFLGDNNKIRKISFSKIDKFLLACYALHFLSGIYYIVKIFNSGSFY